MPPSERSSSEAEPFNFIPLHEERQNNSKSSRNHDKYIYPIEALDDSVKSRRLLSRRKVFEKSPICPRGGLLHYRFWYRSNDSHKPVGRLVEEDAVGDCQGTCDACDLAKTDEGDDPWDGCTTDLFSSHAIKYPTKCYKPLE